MSELSSELAEQLRAARHDAGQLLDDEGRIKFTDDIKARLRAGPGDITDAAPQDPIHTIVGVQEFINRSDNFFLKFGPRGTEDEPPDEWTRHELENRWLQRLRLLFPSLDEAAVALVQFRKQKLLEERMDKGYVQLNEDGLIPIDIEYADFMRFVYSVASQLVDKNDPFGSGTVGTATSKVRAVLL